MIVAAIVAGFCLSGAESSNREFRECTDCPVMLAIPGGSFTMGSPANEAGRFDSEGPQHPVTLRAFALGKFDITSEQFLQFLKETGYQPQPCDRLLDLGWHSPGKGIAHPPYVGEPPRWPAVCLNWSDAQDYIAWLNRKVREARPGLVSGPRALSPSQRSRVGICRPGRHSDRALVGRCAGPRKCELQRLRKQFRLPLSRRCGQLCSQSVQAFRRSGQCLAMDG